jgi:hypothetical protein
MRITTILLAFTLFTNSAHAQEISFRDSAALYNFQRIKKNFEGKRVLLTWGLANVAEGGIGYFVARQDEWKGFHAMNAGWGILNACGGFIGMQKALRQSHTKVDYRQAYNQYIHDKRHYLLSACFDVVCMAGGVALTKSADNMANPAVMRGFGKSLTIQGIGLLLFDNVMYGAHVANNEKWARLMDEIRFTGGGVGFNYNF